MTAFYSSHNNDAYSPSESLGVIYIYALLCPDTGRTMYIGKSKKPKNRFSTYKSRKQISSTAITEWVERLKLNNQEPKLQVLKCVPEIEVDFWENHYMFVHKMRGNDLLNFKSGGEFGRFFDKHKLSDLTRMGLDRAKKAGIILGRPFGKMSDADYLKKYKPISDDLLSGISINKCTTIHNVNKATVRKVKRALHNINVNKT